MWLVDTIRYGRFLMGAAVLLSLVACERDRPPLTGERIASAAASRAPDPLAPKARAVAPAAVPKGTGLFIREITDYPAPDTLATWQWTAAQWDSLTADWDKNKDVYSTTHFGRFCLVEGLEAPRLLYHATAQDSAWTEIDLALPQVDIQWGMESRGTTLDTVNLDGRGAAELVLRFRPASYGSGGGTVWDHVSVLDVSSTPLLVFRALLAAEEEAFAGYATMHGIKMVPGEEFTGCMRSFKVRRRELVLGQAKTIGNTKTEECTLTPLPAGRYHYQNGRMFRVRK